MRVFLSWSGALSKEIADIFRRWLPAVLQSVKPYFTPDDIEKGARWNGEISKELEASRVGLLFLTPENLEAPWLMFEAGALAKNLDRSRVCPILFGLEAADIKGPLVQFQACQFEVDDIFRVVKMMNENLGDAALGGEVLDSVFKKWWPDLETQVTEAMSKGIDASARDLRSERDILEEVLALTRSMVRNPAWRRGGAPNMVYTDVLGAFSALTEVLETRKGDTGLAAAIDRLRRPLRYFARHAYQGRPTRDLRRLLELLETSTPVAAAPLEGPKEASADDASDDES
jgi:TIR domain